MKLQRLFMNAINTFIRTFVRTKTQQVLNRGDTRWECEKCGAIKPKVAAKFYTMDGVVCRKCSRGV